MSEYHWTWDTDPLEAKHNDRGELILPRLDGQHFQGNPVVVAGDDEDDFGPPVVFDGQGETGEMPSNENGAQREKMFEAHYGLFPFAEVVPAYSRVAHFGAKKYAPWNWTKGLGRLQIIGSMFRHSWAYMRGEDLDPESGLSHVDHILWNACALAHAEHHGIGDDRTIEPSRDYDAD